MLGHRRRANFGAISAFRSASRSAPRDAWKPACWGLFAFFAFCFFATPLALAADDVAALSAVIDQQIVAGWEKTGTRPAELSTDEEFLRRIYLDLAGRIPTQRELEVFLAASEPDKRRRCIDQLLASDEFVTHWANHLNGMLQGRAAFPMSAAWGSYLRDSVATGKGWDQIARELILARPAGEEVAGASEFLAKRYVAPEPLDEVTRDVTRLLFGVDMQCARCHVHPEVREWEPVSYWGMAAFFNRTYAVQVGGKGMLAERARGDVSFTTPDKKSHTAEPRFMTGTTAPAQSPLPAEDPARLAQRKKAYPDAKDGNPLLDNPSEYHLAPTKNPLAAALPIYSRRQALVDLAINPENPYFARSIVNRTWAWMVGRGLVEPLDQLHSANPASHPDLLVAMCEDFTRHGYDFRRLLSAIAGSRVYQLASHRPGEPPEARPPVERFAVAQLKPLSLHQYATSLLCAIGELDSAVTRAKFDQQQGERIVRLIKQLDPGTEHFQPSLQISLFLANSEEFDKLISEGALTRRLAETIDDAALVRLAFESVLARRPAPEETEEAVRYLAQRSDRRVDACKQLVWGLLNSSEFRFNH